MRLALTQNKFNSNPYWSNPISQEIIPSIEQTELFDQNGYDLTPLERLYAEANGQAGRWHRPNHYALKRDWFIDEKNSVTAAHINHALLFERKGYTGAALAQLEGWARHNNLIYKIIKMRPKWGMDISVDYVDTAGNVFELLHWEYDGFDYQEIADKKTQIEKFLLNVDWNSAAAEMIRRKSEWHHLGFFEQSAWKTEFFSMEKERFKMVLWQ
jgi:hypothetical protein